MEKKVIRAALLGLGTVGTGVYKVLKSQKEEMIPKLGSEIEISKVLVRNLEKAASKVEDPKILTNNWDDIVNDPEIDIVIELIGGIEPARTYILSALNAGNAAELFAMADIDGGLVGGASLKPDFGKIVCYK